MTQLKLASALSLAAVLALAAVTSNVYAQSATGSATISGTCGLSLNSTAISFGTLAKDEVSGVDDRTIQFTNGGSVPASVTVSGKNWLDSLSIEHIAGELTRFSTSDQGTDAAGVAYGSKSPLNSTDGAVTFGVVKTSPSVNNTKWQLTATLTNLPFNGILTQDITFTGSCLE